MKGVRPSQGSYTEKYRYCTGCKYTGVWSPLSIRTEITRKREQFQAILDHMQHYGSGYT